MSLRGKFILYLILIHLIFIAVSAVVLLESPVWLLAVEIFFLLSFIVGFLLIRSLFTPIDLIRAGVTRFAHLPDQSSGVSSD